MDEESSNSSSLFSNSNTNSTPICSTGDSHISASEDSFTEQQNSSSRFSKCKGYSLTNFSYSTFPFQLFDDLLSQSICFENKNFHSYQCSQNNYQNLNPNEEANEECKKLEYNLILKNVIKRMHNIEKCTNHIFMNYCQLKEVIDKFSLSENNLKLEMLNQNREIISLRNKITLYKRFKTLLTQDDIPRVHQLIKVCVNNGHGISTIVDKLQ